MKVQVNKMRPSTEGRKSLVSSNARIFQVLSSSNTRLHEQTSPELENVDNDLFSSFRGFLILGRCLGLVPVSGVFKHSYTNLKCSFISFAGLCSILCILFLAFNTGLAIADAFGHPKRNASEIAYSIRTPIIVSWGLFLYIYFLIQRKVFVRIFKVWAECSPNLTYTLKDSALKWVIISTSLVMFISTILENAVLHMEYFVVFDDINGHTKKYGPEINKNISALEMYYFRAHPYWNKFIGSHPILHVLAFISHKLTFYGGNYVDVMIALFARALYFKLYALNKTAEKNLLRPLIPIEKFDTFQPTQSDRKAWNQLAKDHDSICEMLNSMNDFFSPVIFVSYAVNIYHFCIQLLYTLNPDMSKDSIVHSIHYPSSFVHVIARTFLLSLFMARINEYAHKTGEIVMRCPVELYNGPIARLDKRVNMGPKIGMVGLGTFTVTKPFMLSIINVVFTIEIVLLQGLSSSSGSTNAQNNCP